MRGKDLSRTRAFQQMEGLAKDTAALEDIYNRMVQMAENGAQERQAEKTSFSVKEENEHYDHSKPFIQQVDDLLEGKVPKDDALLIGGTPDVLQKIGFSNLPLTMNAEHIKSMNRDTEHALSRAFMEQLPELIKNPLAVIESKTNQEGSTVILLNAVVNGKPYIAPAYITTTSMQNGLKIDSNNIATVFRKGNAITRMLTDAIQKENAGETGVYYWKKSEARSLFAETGVQFPGGAIQDGLIHSILKNDSPVNRKYLEQTETKQTLVWGKAWQWTRMGSRSAADNVGTFGWFSPDRRYGLKANSSRELIGLKESFQYISITMGAAIPHGSHCYLLFLGSFALEDLNQQTALAGAEGVDANRKIIIVAENEVQLDVADGGVLMHGQVFGAARAVGTAVQHRQAGKLAHGVVKRGTALAGAAAVAQLTAAVDQHRRGVIAVGALVGADLGVEVQ